MKQNFILLTVSLLLFSCESIRTGGDDLPCSQIKDIGIFENERDLPLVGESELSFFNLRGEERDVQVNHSFNQQEVTEFSLTSHVSDCIRTNDVEQVVWQQEEHQLNYITDVVSTIVVFEKIVIDSLNPDNGLIGEYLEIQFHSPGFNGNTNSFNVMAFPLNGSDFPLNSKFNFGYDRFENIIINGRTFPKVFASKNFFIATEIIRIFLLPSGELVAFETINGETYVIN